MSRPTQKTILILLLLLVLSSLQAQAERATVDEMRAVAENWLSVSLKEDGIWAGSKSPQILSEAGIIVGDTLVGYYFAVEPRGFIIVPVLKDMPPVMACSEEYGLVLSDEGGFPAMIREVLMDRVHTFGERYGSLDAVVNTSEPSLFSRSYRDLWEIFSTRETTLKRFVENQDKFTPQDIEPMLTTAWSQYSPYNNDCPMGDGGRTVAGCVPAAVAQLIGYYNWPPDGEGTTSYSWNGDQSCGGNVGGGTLSAIYSDAYDWQNMPNDCLSGCSTVQQQALSELIYEIGVAYNSDWGKCGTSASVLDATYVLPTFYRYKTGIELKSRGSYSFGEWSDIMRLELEAGRPFLYRIYLHAMVCDGWRLSGGLHQVHMNYGWGGPYTAWYTIDELHCDWPGCGLGQEAIAMKIVPDFGGKIISTADAGLGSLRWTIDEANLNPGTDTIRFLVSGTITLTTPLPSITDNQTIILGSQSPSGPHSLIVDGSALISGDGLTISSANNVVEGLTIRNFPGNGITVTGGTSTGNQITNNLIYNNDGLAIDLGNDGVTVNDAGDLDSGPNNLLNYPTVDSIYQNPDSTFSLYGTSELNSIIEIYVAHPAENTNVPADPSGYGEGYSLIGYDTADSRGPFIFTIPKTVGKFSQISMTAHDAAGNTSEFSVNEVLKPSPLEIIAFSPWVNMFVYDNTGAYIGRDSMGVLYQTLFPADYFDNEYDTVYIYRPVLGPYMIVVLAEQGAPPGATYGVGIRIDGSVQAIITPANMVVPTSGTTDTLYYDFEEGYHFGNGDANGNEFVNILDVTYLISYLYKNGPAPNPLIAGDSQCNGIINILDVTYIIGYLYKGGQRPCPFY